MPAQLPSLLSDQPRYGQVWNFRLLDSVRVSLAPLWRAGIEERAHLALVIPHHEDGRVPDARCAWPASRFDVVKAFAYEPQYRLRSGRIRREDDTCGSKAWWALVHTKNVVEILLGHCTNR